MSPLKEYPHEKRKNLQERLLYPFCEISTDVSEILVHKNIQCEDQTGGIKGLCVVSVMLSSKSQARGRMA